MNKRTGPFTLGWALLSPVLLASLLACGGGHDLSSPPRGKAELAVVLAPRPRTAGAHYTWMAVQDGDGSWSTLDPKLDRWQVAVADPQGRYALAWVWEAQGTSSGANVNVLRSTLGSDPSIELPLPTDDLPAVETTSTRLRVSGLPSDGLVVVSSVDPHGKNWYWGLCREMGPDCATIPSIPAGPQDVTLVQGHLNVGQGAPLIAEKALLVRAFDPAAHPEGLEVDLSLAQPVKSYSATLGGPFPDLVMKISGISTAGGNLFADTTSATDLIQGVLLPWNLPDGQFYTLYVIGPTPTRAHDRWIEACHRGVPPARIDLPEALEGVQFRMVPASGQGVDILVTAPPTAAWDGFTFQANQTMDGQGWITWSVSGRNREGSPLSMTVPSFDGLPGWKPAWSLHNTRCFGYGLTALRSNLPWSGGMGILQQRDGLVVEGASANGTWSPDE